LNFKLGLRVYVFSANTLHFLQVAKQKIDLYSCDKNKKCYAYIKVEGFQQLFYKLTWSEV